MLTLSLLWHWPTCQVCMCMCVMEVYVCIRKCPYIFVSLIMIANAMTCILWSIYIAARIIIMSCYTQEGQQQYGKHTLMVGRTDRCIVGSTIPHQRLTKLYWSGLFSSLHIRGGHIVNIVKNTFYWKLSIIMDVIQVRVTPIYYLMVL